MKIRSLLNGGVAEINDEAAKALIESGHWASVSAPAPRKTAARKRTPRAKAAPVVTEE